MRYKAILILILLFLPTFLSPVYAQPVPAGKDLPKIAVWDLAAGNINSSYAQDLTNILVSEISKLKKYEVYSQENVRTLAGWTAERMTLGCTDTKCLTALGQMDIAKLISGRVGKIGNRYSVSLNLFDTQNAKAENAVSEFGASEGELIDLVQVAVRKLLGIEISLPELRIRQAIKDLDRAIELNPKDARSYSHRAANYIKLDDYQQAIKDLDKVIELDPKSAAVYSGRGFTLYRLGDNQQAIRDFDKAIELDPKSVAVYVLRAAAYGKLGDHQQAIRDFNRAIELDPKEKLTYYQRGVAYVNLKDYQHAIKDFDKGIELNPKDGRAYYLRGLVYGKLGDHQGAIRDFNRAIELSPNSAEAYSGRAFAYFRNNRYHEAIEDFNKAIEIKPNVPQAYNNRGYVYIDLENLQFAERDLKKALELYGSSDRRMDPYIGLAIVYFRQGKKEEAKNYYQEAIKIDSLCKGGGELLEKERGYFYSPGHKKTINEILSLFPAK